MFNVIKDGLAKMLIIIIRNIGTLIPKKRKLVLFGSMNGLYYGDNSKYMFEWVLKNRTDLEVYWIAGSRDVFRDLKQLNLPVLYNRSLLGVIKLMSAKVAIFTNSLKDIAYNQFSVPKNIKLIALRHGKSVKKVRHATENNKISKHEEKYRLFEASLVRYVISTSTYISEIQEKSLLFGAEKHIVTGYPRNDVIVEIPLDKKIEWEQYVYKIKPKISVLYAPTWRHGKMQTKFFPFDDFKLNQLHSFLNENKILLLLRPHVNDLLKYPKMRVWLETISAKNEYLRISSHESFPDVYSILPFTDALVTDYSSIYHDYLLCNKPMMFIPYDYKYFGKEMGFFYDYFDLLPGPYVKNFKDFKSYLLKILNGEDLNKESRESLLNLIHANKDARSCERVMVLIDLLLNEKNNTMML